MSYWDIANMARDYDLQSRIYACVAQETGNEGGVIEFLVICAAPGWDAAWASALASDNPAPGRDPGVITDGQVLSATQEWLASQPDAGDV